ncbi:MAG: neutral/alkaline non-lysosomal ceramidase N-terminal domain-containing protein [Clostridia bacterium]|nr:neutral/alkaline non-lysosomal ceramidase N-terminal domain-containing protein [Clostridia bacterium]
MPDKVFTVGAAKADITPEVGTLLYGYVPDSVSTSVHDGLELTAVAFAEGEEKALLISLSVGDIQTELAQTLRKLAGDAAGIRYENVVIAATHTHSAPNVSGMEGWGDVDHKYIDEILIPALCSASKRAAENMRPAEIAVGVVHSEIGINRRQQLKNGFIQLGQNPWGCFDPFMTLLSIRGEDDKKGIVNIIHYGCHGTAAGNNREITRDWIGVMTDRLQRETGVPTTFFNGALGDVGPRLTNGQTTGDISHVEELGGAAASDALRVYRSLGVYKKGTLKVIRADVSIPRKPLPPIEVLQAQIARFTEPDKAINIDRLEYAHLRSALDEYEAGCPPYEEKYTFDQTIISIGDIAIVPFPFEIFSEISLRLREYSPYAYTLSVSNANGYSAYLPSQDQIVRGGYEVGCFRYSGAHPLVDNADQILIEENLKLLEKAYTE